MRSFSLRSKHGKAPFSNQARALIGTYPLPQAGRPATCNELGVLRRGGRRCAKSEQGNSVGDRGRGSQLAVWRVRIAFKAQMQKWKWNSSSASLFVMTRRSERTRLCQTGLLA